MLDAKVLQALDKQIASVIETKVDAKVKELLADGHDGKGGRAAKEHAEHLKWALESVLALVERGLRVEIRYLTPDKSTVTPESTKTFETLAEVTKDLEFPQIEKTAYLALPSPEPTEPPAADPPKGKDKGKEKK